MRYFLWGYRIVTFLAVDCPKSIAYCKRICYNKRVLIRKAAIRLPRANPLISFYENVDLEINYKNDEVRYDKRRFVP